MRLCFKSQFLVLTVLTLVSVAALAKADIMVLKHHNEIHAHVTQDLMGTHDFWNKSDSLGSYSASIGAHYARVTSASTLGANSIWIHATAIGGENLEGSGYSSAATSLRFQVSLSGRYFVFASIAQSSPTASVQLLANGSLVFKLSPGSLGYAADYYFEVGQTYEIDTSAGSGFSQADYSISVGLAP